MKRKEQGRFYSNLLDWHRAWWSRLYSGTVSVINMAGVIGRVDYAGIEALSRPCWQGLYTATISIPPQPRHHPSRVWHWCSQWLCPTAENSNDITRSSSVQYRKTQERLCSSSDRQNSPPPTDKDGVASESGEIYLVGNVSGNLTDEIVNSREIHAKLYQCCEPSNNEIGRDRKIGRAPIDGRLPSTSALGIVPYSNSNMASVGYISAAHHVFVKKTFHKPVYCHHCTDILWGIISLGHVCEG